MENTLNELLLTAGTALISFGIAWLKKRFDIKKLKKGEKSLDDV